MLCAIVMNGFRTLETPFLADHGSPPEAILCLAKSW